MRKVNVSFILLGLLMSVTCISCTDQLPTQEGLVLDLNADLGVSLDQDNMVIAWRNQAPNPKALDFKITEDGRTEILVKQTELGTGRPALKTGNEEINNHSSLVFISDELINDNDRAFDGMMTGNGYTWFAVLKPYQQVTPDNAGPGYPNAFFGCLRNSGTPQLEDGRYAGFWGSFYRDGRVYMGSRNGLHLTTRDGINTPEVAGPALPVDEWYIVMGRQGSGQDTVMLDIFVDNVDQAANSMKFPVGNVEPSRMAIGTERNAINHQGGESYEGEIARLLMYERDLNQEQMGEVLGYLKRSYGLN